MTAPAHILLVEDDPALAELTRFALGDFDVDLSHASTGAAALARAAAPPPPRLVLLDLDLPDMRGFEVLDGIRGGAAGHAIPVVVLSSSEEEADLARAATGGANSYVVKPAEFEAFRDTVRRTVSYWLELHRPLAAEGTP